MPGANTVTFTAMDGIGNQTVHTVNVNYVANQTWPSTYTADWSTVTNIQSLGQIVDGHWSLPRRRHDSEYGTGYDRLVAIGDMISWKSYVATAEVTLNYLHNLAQPTPPGGDSEFGVGIVMGWTGHTLLDNGVIKNVQPVIGHPFTMVAWYHQLSYPRLELYSNTSSHPESVIAYDTTGIQLSYGVKYIFKVQAQQISGTNTTQYSFKVWPASGTEPANWQVSAAGDLSVGSILLAAHRADVNFGKVVVTPLP